MVMKSKMKLIEAQMMSLATECDELRAKNKELREALKWVDEVYPAKNRESGGAIVHMTWAQFNRMRRLIGARECQIPDRYTDTIRIKPARRALGDQSEPLGG